MLKRKMIFQKCFKLPVIFILATIWITSSTVSATNDYLIIYHDDLAGSALNQLISLQQSRGFTVSTYTVMDGMSRDDIKQAITNTYFTTDLDYVLLVGSARRDDDTVNCLDCYADASADNLIPTLFEKDGNGHLSSFDYWYSVVDQRGSWDALKMPWPNVVVGRIPARDTQDLQVYVDKLAYYLNDVTPADWKDEVLFISGDKDRGDIGSGNPTPGRINREISELNAVLSDKFSTRALKYSDFSTIQDAEDAIVSNLDEGRVLVNVLTTGSNALNIAYMLIRAGDGFEAANDLQANDKYSVWLAASCNLGQSDFVGEGDTRLFPEDLLFAPNRGAIAYVGPSGFSAEEENFRFCMDFIDRMLQFPYLSLGEYFVCAQYADTLGSNTNPATLRMYTFYGDPSIPLNTISLPSETQRLFDFEFGKPLPQEETVYTICNQVQETTCGISTMGGVYGTDRIYKVAGQDQADAGEQCYKSWLLYDELNLPISDSTRFMQCVIGSYDHPENVGRFGINGVLSTGALLSDQVSGQYIVDQYGERVSAENRNNALGESKWYVFDLLLLQGETLDKLIVEYAAAAPSSEGPFDFRLLYANFTAEWGSAPILSEIDAPSSMLVNQSATVSVYADDNDFVRGDVLAYNWTCSAGYFTGSGPSVIYHSPSSAQTVSIFVDVTDLSDHVVTRNESIEVSTGSGGCPFLYLYTENTFKFENVILTGSEIDGRDSTVTTDYYLLDHIPDIEDGQITLRISEEENELSHLYNLSLIAYDISDMQPGEDLAINNYGDLVAVSNPIVPILAETQDGFNVLDKIRETDGNPFISYDKGFLNMVFDLRSFYVGSGSKNIMTDDGGGGVVDPPGKDPVMEKATVENRIQNYLSVNTVDENRDTIVIGYVNPRVAPSTPNLIDFTKHLTDDNCRWFPIMLHWERHYRIDQFAFYHYRKLPVLSEISLSQAVDNNSIDITANLNAGGGQSYSLSPDNYIDIAMDVPKEIIKATQVKYVLKTVGYYEPYSLYNSPFDDQGLLQSQNYPNPFNTGTTIRFYLPVQANVELTVYNLLGQKVKVLHLGLMEPGTQSVTWTGSDENDLPVSTGVYFYQLKAGDFIDTKKMILLK